MGWNPTGVRDFFSFSVWLHFLARAIEVGLLLKKALCGIFIRALNS